MGMPISVAISGRHASSAEGEAAWDQVVASLREADAVFSTYRPDSCISRLGRNEITLAECPPEVREVLALADAARRDSEGAFDISLPGPKGRRVLDPSGVVKGWAVDRASRYLDRLQDTDFCLSAGGDMVCRTRQADSPEWRIGIEHPLHPDRVVAVVPLRNGAVATSGLIHRGAHITDPRTGATPSAWASVTIIAPDLVAADVDATAAFVLGEDAPAWLGNRADRSSLLIRPDGTMQAIGFRG